MLKDLIKKQYKNLILIAAYIIAASLVYGIWFNSIWHLWYINLITVFVIVAVGCVIGYFYLKSEIKKQEQLEAENKEVVADSNASENVEAPTDAEEIIKEEKIEE